MLIWVTEIFTIWINFCHKQILFENLYSSIGFSIARSHHWSVLNFHHTHSLLGSCLQSSIYTTPPFTTFPHLFVCFFFFPLFTVSYLYHHLCQAWACPLSHPGILGHVWELWWPTTFIPWFQNHHVILRNIPFYCVCFLFFLLSISHQAKLQLHWWMQSYMWWFWKYFDWTYLVFSMSQFWM